MAEWKEPERKFCKECKERGERSTVYSAHSESIMIKLPGDYDEAGKFQFYQICKQIEVFICSNKHIWSELNKP